MNMDLKDVSIPGSISLQGFHLQDPFEELESHAPPPRKRIQLVSIYDGVETGSSLPQSDVDLESPFQSEDESTKPLTSHSNSSTNITSNGSGLNDLLEDFTVPVYPLLEDIHIEEEDTSYSFHVPDFSAFNDSKLYPGAPVSNLYAVSLLFSWFGAFPGVSKQSFSHLLSILHNYILPSDNTLPTNYTSAMKMLNPYLSPLKEFHCCVNDCLIFRKCSNGDYSCLNQCPYCGENRYEENGKTPRKVFKHMPIETRLRRLFANSVTSKLIQSHRKPKTDKVSSIHQSKAWSDWYDGTFKSDDRALALGLSADGLNPFAKEKNSYSMWPIFLFVLNLPSQMWKKPNSMMLTGIVPGPGEPKNFDPYIDIVVEEVLNLNCVRVYDGYHDEHFQLQANVILQVFDYPGQNKLLKCVGSGGYSGCSYCCATGEYSQQLQKIVYLDHRAFLPEVDLLRHNHDGYPQEYVPPMPKPKTQAYIDWANGSYSAAVTNKERTKLARETGCKGPYSLRRLPHHDRHLSTPVEPMHILKNVAERIVHTLNGIKDSLKVRREEEERGRFRNTWVATGNEKGPLPNAPFRLKASEVVVADKRLLSIKVPHGTDWKCQKLFDKSISSHMKSIHWRHIIVSGILKFCIRGFLGEKQRHTLFKLCDVISSLNSETVDMQMLDSMEYRLHNALSLLERDFPVSLNVITLHLLHHLPTYVRRFGPVHGYWMYPMERLNSWISRRVLNRRFPEATVMASYRLFEFSSFLQLIKAHVTVDVTEDINLDEMDNSSEKEKHSSLSPKQAMELYKYYRLTQPDRVSSILDAQYQKEMRMSVNQRSFPQFTVWLRQKEMECGSHTTENASSTLIISNQVQLCPFYSVQDEFGRIIKFSKHVDKSNSVYSSSYICLRPDSIICPPLYENVPTFGRIQMIFKHKFDGKLYTLLFIHWFSSSTKDPESGLYFADTNSYDCCVCSVVSAADVSNPLIHAIDHENLNKLWILNYHSFNN